jgi:glycogen(starch) synthase
MRILMTADAVGGVWTYALDLCEELCTAGIEVVLATMGPLPDAKQRAAARQIRGLVLHSCAAKLEWMSDPWNEVDAAGRWLQRLAAHHAVDLVHLNGYAHAALDWHVPVVVVAHSCVRSWWRAVHGTEPDAAWDIYKRRVSAGLRAADCVVSPTAAFLAELTALYGDFGSRQVIYNGRASAQPAAEAVPRLQVALSCGRLWDAAKNLHSLDTAAANTDFPIYVAGSTRAPGAEEPSGFPLQAVRQLGKLRPVDLAAWMSRVAVYVHPAVYEPFGLSVLEAAQSGCALLLSDIRTLRELWSDAAVFVDCRNTTALADALQMLLLDPRRCQELGQAARHRAAAFTASHSAGAYLQLYRRVCGNHHPQQVVA